MDQVQKLLCDTIKQKSDCFADRNIFRAMIADCIPNNKLKQNLLLNAFDNDIVRSLRNGSDITLSALNCISQLENDYGITKGAAFWSVQTWCYLLRLDAVAIALETVKPSTQTATGQPASAKSNTYTIGLGIYRAGTDFPAGEISVKIDTPLKKGEIRATSGKNVKRLSGMIDFKDKIYVTLNEGEYLQLESVYGGIDYPAYTFSVTKIN